MIKLENVTKIYYSKGVVATGISKVSLNFDVGEFVVIVGESGSGKSTLLNVISGLDTYEEGEMYVNGMETSHYGEEDRNEYRRKYIANIFQAFNLINSYTVKQNVELALIVNGSNLKENKEKVNEVLKQVGLWKFRNRRVTKLSGGQKQRVAIARALVQETPIIVCDEPTGNLDTKSAKEVFKLLKNISKEKLVIVVTHNFDQVSEYATRVVKMHDGKVLEDNIIEEVNEDNELLTINHKSMNLLSRIRLAFRNAFSTFIKLFLCTSVFAIIAFIIIAIMGRNQNLIYTQYTSDISSVFTYADATRIVINKKDGTPFTDDEINKLSNMKNVVSIDDNDEILDLTADFETEDWWGMSGFVKNINDLPEVTLYKGSMPTNDQEILLVVGKNSYYLDNYYIEEILNHNIYLLDYTTYSTTDFGGKLVGIAIQDDYIFPYLPTYYVGDDILNAFYDNVSDAYSSFTYKTNNSTLDSNEGFIIKYSDKVPAGSVYVPEAMITYCKYEYCPGKILSITNTTKYYTKTVDFNMAKVYNSYNYKSLFGIAMPDDDYYNNFIYMNPNDKNLLKSEDVYQLSIFVDDAKNVDKVDEKIDEDIYNHIAIKNTYESDNDLVKLERYLLNCGLFGAVVVILFISYLVIYIILKSRVTYYAVIRMLGGTIKDNRKLVYLELLIYANFGFIIVALLCGLSKYDIFHISFIQSLMLHLDLQYMLIAYVILILMSVVISYKFVKKIFKSSMISTYNMEV